MTHFRTVAATIAVFGAAMGPAAAEIVVSPLRQVVTRNDPVAVYEVVNATPRIIEARVGWVDLSAVETGYAPAAAGARAALSAAPYLVVSPARFRLEPGKRAAVTVRLKKGAAVPSGERRSHLLIRTTPARTPLRRAGGGLEADVELGVSTPVILRAGAAPPAVVIDETRLVRDSEGLLALETKLLRTGKYSAFGALRAEMQAEGRSRTIAQLANVAIYSDAPARRLRIPLGTSRLPAGAMVLSYVGAAEYEGRTFAEKRFEIAPPSE
jgi:hypothetical protein